MVWCECPWVPEVCYGAWSCDDIYGMTEEIFAEYDVNEDNQINLGDYVDADHFEVMVEYCD